MSRTSGQSLILRVTQGLNAGASASLKDGHVVIVGSGEDCDVVLAVPGIARHHCLVTLVDGELQVRAVDASISMAGEPLEPGVEVPLRTLDEIQLTPDTVIVIEPTVPIAMTVTEHGFGSLLTKQNAFGMVRWGLAVMLVIAAGFGIVQGAVDRAPPVSQVEPPLEQLKQFINVMSFNEITVDRSADDRLKINGVVPSPDDLAALQEHAVLSQASVDWQVKVGSQIAADVATILRAQGIVAASKYMGSGNVEVRGKFDERQLASAIESRAMREIDGLAKVVVSNTAVRTISEGKPELGFDPADKRIVSVVRGDDPYLVTADDAIYFVGAFVPGIGKFEGLSNHEIWFNIDGQMVRYDIDLKWSEKLAWTSRLQSPNHL